MPLRTRCLCPYAACFSSKLAVCVPSDQKFSALFCCVYATICARPLCLVQPSGSHLCHTWGAGSIMRPFLRIILGSFSIASLATAPGTLLPCTGARQANCCREAAESTHKPHQAQLLHPKMLMLHSHHSTPTTTKLQPTAVSAPSAPPPQSSVASCHA